MLWRLVWTVKLGGPVSNLIEDSFGLRSRSHLACSRGVKATTLALALTSASAGASESFHFGQTAQHNIAKLQNCETAVQTVNCIFRGRERESGQKLCALLSALLIMLCPSTPFSTVAATWRCCCCWLFLATAKVLLHNLRFNKAKTI